MNSTPQPPVIFLAFANEYRKPDGYLRHLTEEATKIQEALKRAEQTGRCQVILRSNATLDRILDIFQDDNYRDRIAIFHYGGHAEDYGLLLSEAGGQTTLANAAGLAAFLGQQKGLRLVFLNGCSTKPQVEGLLAANVPAVLATAQKINDEVAMRFAARFYQGLAGGASLEEAYHEAEGAIWAKPEWITPRGLYWSEIEEAEQNRRPWALHLKPEAEAAGGWRLFSRPQLSWQRGRVEFYDQNYLRLPPGYLERTELLAELKPALLQAPGQLALTSAIKMNALHGMGGIGKSVMARALCADAEVQAAFPDGTLWTTLGQQPSESDLKSKLSDWVRTLGGIISENNLSLDRLKNLLAEQLQERAYLLVVDDAWRAVDAALFNVGGPECCLLLTTRDAAVAERLGAIIQPVPPMTQAEAVALLEGETAGALAQTDPDLKRRIVERLGRLPLALRLAGDQLRRQPPETWLANFTAQKLRSRRRETVHDNLFDTLALSLADLAEEERRLYLSLAIFKEDEAIPQVAINHLWAELAGYAPEETTDLLHDLAFRTLLQLDPTSLLDFDPPLSSPSLRFTNHAPEITLHDLLRDFITTELGDSGRLTTHQALLSAYRQTQTGEGWPTAPDDGYLYDHLAYHLAQVADHDPVAAAELRELFANDRWLHARVPQSDYLYDSYLADLAFAAQQAHRLAHNQIETGRPLTALADLVHYALIRTSINSLAANYVPALVARAVETDLWSAERALSLASKIFDSKQRAEMTIGILSLSTLTSIQRKRIQAIGMEAALTVKYNWSQTNILLALAPLLEEEDKARVLQLASRIIPNIEPVSARIDALGTLALQLEGEAKILTLEAGLETALAIKDKWSRTNALTALGPQLTGKLLRIAFEEALATVDKWHQAEILKSLAPQLEGELLRKALEFTLAVDNDWYRVNILTALVPQLTDELLQVALKTTLRIRDQYYKARTLCIITPHLKKEIEQKNIQVALETAKTIENKAKQAEILVTLVPQLKGEIRDKVIKLALEVTRAIEDEEERIEILATLAPQLEGKIRTETLQIALEAALVIENKEKQIEILAILIPQLEGEDRVKVLQMLLETIQTSQKNWGQVKGIKRIVSQLEGEPLRLAYKIAMAIEDERDRIDTLSILAPQMDRGILQEVLAASPKLAGEVAQVGVLSTLAPYLEKEAKITILEASLKIALTIKEEQFRALSLTVLAPLLEDKLLQTALTATLAITNRSTRAQVLGTLAPQLEGGASLSIIQMALEDALAIKEELSQAKIISILAPQLEDNIRNSILQKVLRDTIAVKDEWNRTEALRVLAPHLEGELLQIGLKAALAIEDERYRASVLRALASRLDGELLKTGLEAALEIKDKWSQAQTLSIIALQLEGKDKVDLLRLALEAALVVEVEESQAYIIQTLAPQLKGELLEIGLKAALAIQNKRAQARALAPLVTQLDGKTKDQALRGCQYAVSDYLCKLDISREEFFWFLGDKVLINPTTLGVSSQILADIAQDIIQVCNEWRWL